MEPGLNGNMSFLGEFLQSQKHRMKINVNLLTYGKKKKKI